MNKFFSSLWEARYRVLAFAALCLFALASIGGTAYLFYFGRTLFGVANIVLSVMALPCAVIAFQTLNGDEPDDYPY